MSDIHTITTRTLCSQCGANLLREPVYTGQKRGGGLSDETLLRCPKCQPPLASPDQRKDAS